MTPVITGSPQSARTAELPWVTISWVAALLALCYATVLFALARIWFDDADMGHGFFVPLLAGWIAWQKRGEVANRVAKPNWWGLAMVAWGALQLYVGTLGAELFLSRTSFVISLTGTVLFLGGTEYLTIFAFPLFLLLFMIPIPAIIYNQITFPLQLLASRVAEFAIGAVGIPIIREGNILELAQQRLDVVEACSGIRSLLTLTFLSLVYGYFRERRTWIRVALFFSTIPIAIAANAGRVTLTGIIAQFRPELAEGLFHEAQGWVIFMIAFVFLGVVHQTMVRVTALAGGKNA